METIKTFITENSAFTHTVAVVFAFLFGAYFQVPAFHDMVTHYYGLLPQTAKELTATAVALIMWYRSGQKSA